MERKELVATGPGGLVGMGLGPRLGILDTLEDMNRVAEVVRG